MDKRPHEDKSASKGGEKNSEQKPKPDPDQAAKDAAHEQERDALKGRIGELESEVEDLRRYKETREAADKRFAKAEAERGLTIHERRPQVSGTLIRPGKRLYLNAKKNRLVPAGHKDAATLYCTEHDEVQLAEFERLSGR